MPLSRWGAKNLTVLQQKFGFTLTILTAPHTLVAKIQYPIFATNPLLNAGALNHFPSTFFYRKGHLLPLILPGYKNYVESKAALLKYLYGSDWCHNYLVKDNAPPPSITTRLLKTEVAINLDFLPSFFFRMSPDGKYIVGYSSRSGDYGNFLIEVNKDPLQPSKDHKIPGSPDAIFMGDPRWVLLTSTGLEIYDRKDMEKDNDKSKPFFTDSEVSGVYQSFGVLSDDPVRTVYRVIMGYDTDYVIRDYSLDKVTQKFSVASKSGIVCKGQPFKLPMLAKNGREVAGFATDKQTSQVLKIEDDKSCSLAVNLHLTTGKIAFSWDNQWLAFHISNPSGTDTDFIDVPTDNYVADIYLYHRPSKQTFRITSYKSANALYPDFLADGSLVFIEYPHGETHSKILKVSADQIQSLLKQN